MRTHYRAADERFLPAHNMDHHPAGSVTRSGPKHRHSSGVDGEVPGTGSQRDHVGPHLTRRRSNVTDLAFWPLGTPRRGAEPPLHRMPRITRLVQVPPALPRGARRPVNPGLVIRAAQGDHADMSPTCTSVLTFPGCASRRSPPKCLSMPACTPGIAPPRSSPSVIRRGFAVPDPAFLSRVAHMPPPGRIRGAPYRRSLPDGNRRPR